MRPTRIRDIVMKKSLLFALVLTFAIPLVSNAQLKKSSDLERIKSFTNGSVSLYKSTIIGEASNDTIEIYLVTLFNNSRYYDNVVLFLGEKEDMLKNLQDFSDALKNGKKGESFEFDVWGHKYILSYRLVLGQRCFKVSTPNSSSHDFGNFFKSTIDDIIEYFNNIDE